MEFFQLNLYQHDQERMSNFEADPEPKLWWTDISEKIVWALNGSESKLVEIDTEAKLTDGFFEGLGKYVVRTIWCDGEVQRSTVITKEPGIGRLSSASVIIPYQVKGNCITLSVPFLPMGEVALILQTQFPVVRYGSNSAETAPHRLIRGLRQLSWASLYMRFKLSADETKTLETGGTVLAGVNYLELPDDQFSRGEAFDMKMCEGTELTLEEFNRMAWYPHSKHRPPTLAKLLASTVSQESSNDHVRNHYAFRPKEACLVCGVPDMKVGAGGKVVGVELAFDELSLGARCVIFPPLVPSEIRAIRHPVEIPAIGGTLERYVGPERSAETVIQQENGCAWRAMHVDGGCHVLRYSPISKCATGEDNSDALVGGSHSTWEEARNPSEYPANYWKKRFLVRLSIRPEPGSEEFEDVFFDNAEAFRVSEFKTLSCVGVWLRLRPRNWERLFDPGNNLRIEFGSCFKGETPRHLIDESFPKDVDPDSFKLKMRSITSFSRKIIMAVALDATENLLVRVIQLSIDVTRGNPISVVLFVPLEKFQNCRSEVDRSFAQLTSIRSAIPNLAIFNVADVVPILPYTFHPQTVLN